MASQQIKAAFCGRFPFGSCLMVRAKLPRRAGPTARRPVDHLMEAKWSAR
jgi:hypothetical protein